MDSGEINQHDFSKSSWDKREVVPGGWVSFSRSKHYQSAPGAYAKTAARFVYDANILKQHHKIQPYADQMVQGTIGDPLRGAASRWESEEKVKGPIKLSSSDGLVAIELTPTGYADITRNIEAFERNKASAEEKLEKVKEGFFWHQANQQWTPIETEKQKERFTEEGYQQAIQYWDGLLNQQESHLNHPAIKLP